MQAEALGTKAVELPSNYTLRLSIGGLQTEESYHSTQSGRNFLRVARTAVLGTSAVYCTKALED